MIVKKTFLIVLSLTLLCLLIRGYKLTSSPDGLYIDETSIGYNAFSLISTGRDEHGKFLPLFFEAFGEYKLPIYIYSVALVQLITGPTDVSVRLPALLFGVFSVPLLYLLSKELFHSFQITFLKNVVPFLAAFSLVVSPWHFQFARAGFEASAAIFFLLLALYLFFRAVHTKSPLILIASTVCFSLTLYSYNSARIVTPLLLAFLFFLYFKKVSVKNWLFALIIGAVVSLPFLLFVFSPEGSVRARQVSIFFQESEQPVFQQFISNYWKNIDPLYLFIRGDPTIAHLTEHRMSLLYLVELPFFIAGLIFLIVKKTKVSLFLLFWFFISFIPSAVSTLNPHALRSSLGIPVSVVISAGGTVYVFSLVKSLLLRQIAVAVYVIIISISLFRFLDIYHNKYVADSGWDWQVGIKKASLRVAELEKNYISVYFDAGISKVSVLWYLRYNPYEYQHSTEVDDPGNIHFWVESEEFVARDGRSLFVTSGNVTGGTLLEYVYYPNGTIAYGIWQI